MSPLAGAVSGALLHFLWQGAAVALVLSLVLPMVRSARVRYAMACGALSLLAILPVATAWVLYREPVTGVLVAVVTDLPVAGGPVADSVERWVLALWSAGVAVCSVRLALGLRETVRLRRSGEAVGAALATRIEELARQVGYAGPVRALVSTLAEVPAVAGFWRPVILVPAAALAGLAPEHLEAILAHEVAHLRRWDHWVNLAQAVVETLLFYHPAVWWVSARIREERELCCDDLAVAAVGDAACYARALTSLERLRAPALVVAANGGSLLYRVRRLAGAEAGGARSGLPGMVALAAAALGVALSAGFVLAEPSPLPPQAPAPGAPAAQDAAPQEVPPAKDAGTAEQAPVANAGPEPQKTVVLSEEELEAALKEAYYQAGWEEGYLAARLGIAVFSDPPPDEASQAVSLHVATLREMRKAQDRLAATSDAEFRGELLRYLAEQLEALRAQTAKLQAQYGPEQPLPRERDSPLYRPQ